MKKSLLFLLTVIFPLYLFAQNRHSFLPDQNWPDNNGIHINAHGGGFLQYHDTWYWFGEHKIAGRRGNSAQVGVHCYSSTDLYNWKDEGIALAVDPNPDSEITRGQHHRTPQSNLQRQNQ